MRKKIAAHEGEVREERAWQSKKEVGGTGGWVCGRDRGMGHESRTQGNSRRQGKTERGKEPRREEEGNKGNVSKGKIKENEETEKGMYPIK